MNEAVHIEPANKISKLVWSEHNTVKDRNGNLVRGNQATNQDIREFRDSQEKKRIKQNLNLFNRLRVFETKLNARLGYWFTNGNKK